MEVASAPRNAEELYIEVQVVQIIRSDAHFRPGDWQIFWLASRNEDKRGGNLTYLQQC